MQIHAPDLTKRPPRSPRVRLGGYVLLPRLLDKARATIAGTQGEYRFNCPLDQHWFTFTGVDPEALKQQLSGGAGDGEILAWIKANSKQRQNPSQILNWSAYQERRAPADLDAHQFFLDLHSKIAPRREDIATWFDLLDLDDYVSFGGLP